MAATPTSIIKRLQNLEACTDGIQDCAYPLVAVPPATTTLTLVQATHGGAILLLASTGGLAIVPPAATGTGAVYTFIVVSTVSGGAVTVDAKAGNAADVFAGSTYFILSGGTTQTAFPTAANTNLITLNGTTTGGVAGTLVQMIDLKTNLWFATVEGLQTGTGATPFSNH